MTSYASPSMPKPPSKLALARTAADHDFAPDAPMTPVGIFLPASDARFLYGVTSKVTSDGVVDRLGPWWATVRER
jgi:hypothetical protein